METNNSFDLNDSFANTKPVLPKHKEHNDLDPLEALNK